MDRIHEYKEYRRTQKALFHKIIRFAEERYFKEFNNIGKKLEFQIKNNKVCYSGDQEFAFLMDYFLMEHKIEEKTIVEIYEEEIGAENEIEKEVYKFIYKRNSALGNKVKKFKYNRLES